MKIAGARLAYNPIWLLLTAMYASSPMMACRYVIVERAQRLHREVRQEAALREQVELAMAGHAHPHVCMRRE